MKFVILGGGALGSILAAHLIEARQDVTLVARGQRAAWLKANGVRLSGLSTLALACPVETEPSRVREADVFINTVKTYDTKAALAPFAHLKPAVAFSVQNGVMKEEALATTFGADALVGCMADFSGELCDDGSVAFTRNVCLHLGEPGGGHSTRVGTLAATLDAAGIVTRESDAVMEVVWSKYVGWVGLMRLASLTRQRTAVYASDPDSALVLARITREMCRLAAARGIRLRDGSPLPAVSIASRTEEEAVDVVLRTGAGFAANAPGHRMSSLQDADRRRPLEVEETAGHALAMASAAGLTLPTLATCYHLAVAVHRAHLSGG